MQKYETIFLAQIKQGRYQGSIIVELEHIWIFYEMAQSNSLFFTDCVMAFI